MIEKNVEHVSIAIERPKEVLTTAERLLEGQLVEKEVRVVEMDVERLINPQTANPISNVIKPMTSRKIKARNKKQCINLSHSKKIQDCIRKYDVIEALGNAPGDTSIGQLSRGDAIKAQKVL